MSTLHDIGRGTEALFRILKQFTDWLDRDNARQWEQERLAKEALVEEQKVRERLEEEARAKKAIPPKIDPPDEGAIGVKLSPKNGPVITPAKMALPGAPDRTGLNLKHENRLGILDEFSPERKYSAFALSPKHAVFAPSTQ